MTLLLDAEARLFVIPEETRAAPVPPQAREPGRGRVEARAPAAPREPARERVAAPAGARATVAEPSIAPVPEPATWAGEREQRRTLDDVLSDAWEGLSAASATAACPVCDGALEARWSAGAGVVGGRCGDCGSELS
jgi:hypothetical protein